MALRAILGATVTATDVYLTLYLQHQRDFPPVTAGLVIAVGASGWAAGAWVQGRFGDTAANHRGLIAVAVPLALCGPAGVLFHTLGAVPVGLVVGACVVMGTGMGIAYPRVSSATLTIADPSEHGRYSSALQAGESMATAGLLAVTAALLTTVPGGEGFNASYGLLVGFGLVAALIAWTGPTPSRTGVRTPATGSLDGRAGADPPKA